MLTACLCGPHKKSSRHLVWLVLFWFGWKEQLLRTILCSVAFVDDSHLKLLISLEGNRSACVWSQSWTTYHFNRGGPDGEMSTNFSSPGNSIPRRQAARKREPSSVFCAGGDMRHLRHWPKNSLPCARRALLVTIKAWSDLEGSRNIQIKPNQGNSWYSPCCHPRPCWVDVKP